MIDSKFTNDLSIRLLQSQQDKEVQVIVELSSGTPAVAADGLSRQEKIKNLQDVFNTAIKPITSLLQQKGGKILEQAWISGSLHIQAPVSAIESLSDLEEVATIDTPRSIQAD